MKFRIVGTILLKGSGQRKFSKQLEAESERMAKEKTFSFFANVYRMARNKIKITEITKV